MPDRDIAHRLSFGGSSDSFPTSLYRIWMVRGSGWPEAVEVHAVTEALAIERALHYKPSHRLLLDEWGNPIIERRPRPHAGGGPGRR